MSQEILGQSPVFKGIPAEGVKRFLEAGRVREVSPADVIIKEGQYNDSLHVLLEGELEVCLPGGTGRFGKIELARLRPGACVGEYSFIDRKPASAAVIARAPGHIFSLRNDEFVSLLGKHPGVACIIYRNLLNVLIARLREDNAMLDMIRPRR
jgi:CRP-like cAMP-binding protein